MEESPISIVESTKELVISPNAKPIFRTAHFLNPILTSNHQDNSNLYSISLPSPPPKFDPRNWPLSVQCHGWIDPPGGWKAWVSKMASLHSSTWKKAGIYDAIFNSTYNFPRNRDLLLGVAEKWCPDTNSFVFPWGEATITLEDMLIAGFSVLGHPVFEPVETEELKEIQQKLAQARLELVRTPSKEAGHLQWMRKFVDCGSEIEHEAFLSLWLSRFVFPAHKPVISEFVFPIAIHLAGGSRIALAPAVLASIYMDLTWLKQNIAASTELSCKRTTDEKLLVNILSPFQLVLIWIWERFEKMQPEPNLIKHGEPRFARWNNVKCRCEIDVRLALDSSRGTFCWRPYCKPLENWDVSKFYKEKEMWVSVNSDLEDELLSFIQCLRACDLVGLDCILQYHPHRVARQFGYDQDLPGCVVGPKTDPDDAWNSYIRPVGDSMWYIPSSACETGVTTRYFDWLKSLGFDDQANSSKSKSLREEASHKFSNVRQMIIQNLKKKKAAYVLKKSKVSAATSRRKRKYENETKSSLKRIQESSYETQRKNSGETIVGPADVLKQSETVAKSSQIKIEEIVEANNLAAPPGFHPTCGRVQDRDSSEEDNLTIAKILKLKEKQDISRIRQHDSEKKIADKAEHSSLAAADNETTTSSSSEIKEEDNRTIAEILKRRKTQEVISNWDRGGSNNDKKQLTNLIISGSNNESPKDSERQEPTVAENGMMKETGGPEQDVEFEKNLESNGKNKRCKYSLVETLEKLEERVRRIETKIAARKTLLNISGKRG